jgi:hypothetical protein
MIAPRILLSDIADMQISNDALTSIRRNLAKEPPVQAVVRVEQGGPRLFVNGEESYPAFAWSWKLRNVTPDFRDSGINILHPILQLTDGWKSDGTYDWDVFDEFLLTLIHLHPDAYLVPRLLLYMPDWWTAHHPEELVETCLPFDPRHNMSTPELLIGEGGQRWWRDFPKDASFASDVWKTDITQTLLNFLRHYAKSPLKSRILGYHAGLGTTGGEWHYAHAQFLPDTNRKMVKKLGYVPGTSERLTASHGLFRDPVTEARVIEFYRKFHDLNADIILHFADVVKQETERRLIFGVFYNYVLENVWMQEGGHLSPEKILKSEDVDYIASPYTYQQSNLAGARKGETDVYDGAGNWLGRARGTGGDGGYRLLIDSILRHGKIPCVEMDPATFVDKGRDSNFAGSGSSDIKGSVNLLERDLGQMFVSGSGGWLCDIGAVKGDPWYSEDVLKASIKRMIALGQHRKEMRLGSVSEIAACYDTKSFFVTRHWKAEEKYEKGGTFMDFFSYWFLDAQARSIHRMGAPVDFLYRFDLGMQDIRQYKMLFMVNNFYLTKDEIISMRHMLKDSGVTVIWCYAPGYVSPDGLDVRQMEMLTGFRFGIIDKPGPMMIHSTSDEMRYLNFGSGSIRYPRFFVKDVGASVLGRWVDVNAAAFAVKDVDGWRSVYAGTAPLPVEILRRLADSAGTRLWSSKADVVRAREDSAMITATSSGSRRLRLHKPMTHVNSGRTSQTHDMDLEFGQVEIFIRPE